MREGHSVHYHFGVLACWPCISSTWVIGQDSRNADTGIHHFVTRPGFLTIKLGSTIALATPS